MFLGEIQSSLSLYANYWISHVLIKVKESTEHLSGGIEYPDWVRVHATRPQTNIGTPLAAVVRGGETSAGTDTARHLCWMAQWFSAPCTSNGFQHGAVVACGLIISGLIDDFVWFCIFRLFIYTGCKKMKGLMQAFLILTEVLIPAKRQIIANNDLNNWPLLLDFLDLALDH